MGRYGAGEELQVIVRGDGCHVEDAAGRRYLDALAGLFCVNIGYGFGEEMGEAAAAQMRELPFAINWTFAHPRSIELAGSCGLAPGDLNRVFFVSGGSEAVEAAWKLARQHYTARGERRWKAIARRVAYHGTTMGALSINGCADLRAPFEPLVPDVLHVSNTNRYHRPPEETEEQFTSLLLDELEATIQQAGPRDRRDGDRRAGPERGRLVHAAGGLLEGVRELCDRHGILLCFDEVITGFGRAGALVRGGALRRHARPDHVRQGAVVRIRRDRRAVASERVMEPFLAGGRMYTHGMTFGGHPVQAAVALKNIEIMRRERIVEHVRETEADFRAALEQLLELPIVGDLRGAGFFYALELVKDKETRASLQRRGVRRAAARLRVAAPVRGGPLCRADDRGDPVVQISPPLVAGQAEFDTIAGTLGTVLEEAGGRMRVAV